MKIRPIALTITGILLGFLFVLQSRSFRDVQEIYSRDTRANIFREIQILKRTNENLQDEINDLESQLTKASDQEQALNLVKDEIKKNRIIAGHMDISGPGIVVTIKKEVPVIWLTDITNELWSAGAEAVSVNNIRITDSTAGFDVLPSGQIAFNSVILSSPYVFQAIGDKKVLEDSLIQRQGVLERLKTNVAGIGITLDTKESIEMQKVI